MATAFTLGQRLEATRPQLAKQIEQAHHDATVKIWALAKKTTDPIQAQSLLNAQFAAYTHTDDECHHLALCLEWLGERGD